MTLIDKDALVAEIERRKSELQSRIAELSTFESNTLGLFQEMELYDDIISFLNFLEVKEVDLDKEINTYISSNFFGSQTRGFFANRTKEEPNDQDIALCAKHFFELGLQATQKGE